MSLNALRIRIDYWLRRPVGKVAVVGLLAALVLSSLLRVHVHAHIHDDVPHTASEMAAHGATHHDHSPVNQDQADGDKSTAHLHTSGGVASVIGEFSNAAPLRRDAVSVVQQQFCSLAPIACPMELFRPPIA